MKRPPLGGAWWLLAVGVVISCAVLIGNLRLGGYLLGGTVACGGLLRLGLPQNLAGGLVIRSRGTDVLMYFALAAAVFAAFAALRSAG